MVALIRHYRDYYLVKCEAFRDMTAKARDVCTQLQNINLKNNDQEFNIPLLMNAIEI
jgi:hypothetical protein